MLIGEHFPVRHRTVRLYAAAPGLGRLRDFFPNKLLARNGKAGYDFGSLGSKRIFWRFEQDFLSKGFSEIPRKLLDRMVTIGFNARSYSKVAQADGVRFHLTQL